MPERRTTQQVMPSPPPAPRRFGTTARLATTVAATLALTGVAIGYATLNFATRTGIHDSRTGTLFNGHRYVVLGDCAARTVHTLRDRVECP